VSVTYVSAALRRLVVDRAEGLCEYCLMHSADAYVGCEVDHIVSEKHGGPTNETNLAYSCFYCNRLKGTDLGSIGLETGELVRFFNPRTDRWSEHFVLDGLLIVPRTEIGVVTQRIVGFNSEDRVLERQVLQTEGRYPTAAAMKRVQGQL